MLQINNQNNLNFGQLNLIRIPKKSFKKPDDIKSCVIEFNKQMCKIEGGQIGRTTLGLYINQLLHIYFGKKIRSTTHLEGHSGLNLLHKPLEEHYHSFVLATGDENTKLLKLISKENIRKKARDVVSLQDYNKYKQEIYNNQTQYMSLTDKIICFRKYAIQKALDLVARETHDAFSGTKIHEYRNNNKNELESIKDKLGLSK